MLKHADWKNEAVGTIVSVNTQLTTLYDGSTDVLYWVDFDEPQREYSDELNGLDLPYRSSQVLSRYLRLLD